MKTELDRRIQVEELHAHRKVMEPIRNADRLEQYESKKSLSRCFPVSGSTPRGAENNTATILTFNTKGGG